MIHKTSIVIAAAVGTSLLAAAAIQTGQERESGVFEGRIVDLHHYMTIDETPDLGDPGIAGENFGGPVGLLVEEQRRIFPNRTVLYVVLVAPEDETAAPQEFQPDADPDREPIGPSDHENMRDHHDEREVIRNKDGAEMFKKAKEMTGETVRIIGQQLERDNMKAVVVRSIEQQELPITDDREPLPGN